MEKTFAKAEELADNIREYVDNRVDVVKLQVAEKSSAIFANILAGMAVALVFFCFIIFAGAGLAFFLGEWIGKLWAGFLIVAGLYMLVGIVVWTAREKIIRIPVMNALIKQLFSDDDED